MKNFWVASTILWVSGIACAQTIVTMYGTMDITLGAASGTNKPSQTKVESGSGSNASQIGIRGSENLGDGLKASFVLENGFNADTGASAVPAQTFSRQAFVAISGEQGEVRLGKTWTPFDDTNWRANPAFDSELSPQNGVWVSTNYQANPANTVYFASQSLSGFVTSLSRSFSEDNFNKVAGDNSPRSVTSASIQYADGPWYAGLASQIEKASDGNANVGFTRINASYDLGVAKLLLGYGRVLNARFKASTDANGALTNAFQFEPGAVVTEWELGADVPLSSALTLSGGMAYSKDNAVAGDASRRGYGLAASYALSRRTSIYGGLRANTTSTSGEGYTDHLAAMGIKHAF